MTNVTTLKAGGALGASIGKSVVKVIEHEIDIADVVTAGLTTGGVVTIATIPANTYFELLQAEVVTAIVLGGSADFKMGDTDDDDQFVTTTATLTAGLELTLATPTGSLGPVYNATKDITMTLTGDNITAGTATGKIRFVWLAADTARVAPTTFVGNVD